MRKKITRKTFCCLQWCQTILIVAIYIHVNLTITDTIDFIHKQLLAYTPLGSAALRKYYDKRPMILSGDFNVNFASIDSELLIDFLREDLNLKMNNNPNAPTTRYGTTIDATFQRYLDKLQFKSLSTYFSYHKAIVSFLEDYDGHPTTDNEWTSIVTWIKKTKKRIKFLSNIYT